MRVEAEQKTGLRAAKYWDDGLLRAVWPWPRRTLVRQMVRQEVLGRYRGSFLGPAWALLMPLIMLGVYTFVFKFVFQARWPGRADMGGVAFALDLFAGLVVFNWFAEVFNRAPRLVLEQPHLVKKVVFPLEMLPWVALCSGGFQTMMSLAVLLAATFLVHGAPGPALLALPLVLAAFVPFLLGIGWLLASLGVYLRDIAHLTAPAGNILLFLGPVFYPISAVPEKFQPLLYLNPMTFIIENVRGCLHGAWPYWPGLMLYAALGLGFAVLSAKWFVSAKKGFADVL